jgi:hypothetical protein
LCWLIWKTSWTLNPILKLDDLIILTKKHPSPDANPANQWRSGIFCPSGKLTKGLFTGITLGKAAFSLSERPLLIENFIYIIFWSPSIVICSFLLIKLKTSLNKR